MAIRLTTQEFIKRATTIHGDTYCYDKSIYKNVITPLVITCREHGDFKATPNNHLYSRTGCPECAKVQWRSKVRKTTEIFIAEAKAAHGDNYDYSETRYKGSNKKLKLICPSHGPFFQRADQHLAGHGCTKCWNKRHSENLTLTTGQFIENALSVHGDRYDYSQVEYVDTKSKVGIVCKRHGVFSQTPHSHIQGSGCPACSARSGEDAIRAVLDSLGIFYVEQKIFPQCRDKAPLRWDFFLPQMSPPVLIEYQGAQHYEPIEHFGGKKALAKLQRRDAIKRTWADKQGFVMIEIPYWEEDGSSFLLSHLDIESAQTSTRYRQARFDFA